MILRKPLKRKERKEKTKRRKKRVKTKRVEEILKKGMKKNPFRRKQMEKKVDLKESRWRS